MPREMKESGVDWIGAIPKDWKTSIVRNCLMEINDSNNPIKTTNVLSLTNRLGVVPYEEKGNQGNKSKEDYSGYKLAYENTIVANSMNVLIGSVGISNYYGCVSPVYYVFRAKDSVDLRYINYVFLNAGFQKELRKYAKGIMEIRLRVSSRDILRRMIPLPSRSMQKNISDYLDKECNRIDKIITDTERSIEEYKKLKQSIITEAVTKGVRGHNREMKDSGIEWIGQIPKEWTIVPVKKYFRIENGSDPETNEGDTPVYGSGSKTFKTCAEFKVGPTVLLGRKGTVNIPQYVVGNYWNVDTAFNVLPKGGYDLKMFYYVACCFDYERYSTQTTIPSMTQSNYYSFKIPEMIMDEQKEIIGYLEKRCSELDKIIDKKQRFVDELGNYKKSIIYEYVTGKKEVPEQ